MSELSKAHKLIGDKFVELCENNDIIRKACEDVSKCLDNKEGLCSLAWAVAEAYFIGLANGRKLGYGTRIQDEIMQAIDYEFLVDEDEDEDEEEEEED